MWYTVANNIQIAYNLLVTFKTTPVTEIALEIFGEKKPSFQALVGPYFELYS